MSDCLCEKSRGFIFGKRFQYRSNKSKEKIADATMFLSNTMIVGGFIWVASPLLFALNTGLASANNKLFSDVLADIVQSNGWNYFEYILGAVFVLVIAGYFRRRACDIYDELSKG